MLHEGGHRGLPEFRNYIKLQSLNPRVGWKTMDRPDFQDDIRELNLAYLLLAQQMLRSDRATALFRLGIGEAFADLIESMSAAKLVRMASSQVLLPCFRFDDAQLARLMAGEGRDAASAGLHAAILAAGKAAADAR
jgi:flagellar transcriptional activator FlhD